MIDPSGDERTLLIEGIQQRCEAIIADGRLPEPEAGLPTRVPVLTPGGPQREAPAPPESPKAWSKALAAIEAG